MVVEDDHDVIHDNNSSDLALFANLNDLDFRTLNIDDDIPYDLADSDNEVIANYDDDDEFATMAAEVAPGHGGDGADDTPPPPVRLLAVANGHFDLKHHMHGLRWTTIMDDIENYFAKR
ncbi:hypothetical protein Tco_1400698 [Tanacetum coccineum]